MKDSPGRVILGVLLGLALMIPLHFVGLCAGMLFMIVSGFAPSDRTWPDPTQMWFLTTLGLWQWLYLLPTILVARRLGARWTAIGMVIGGALTLLIVSGCGLMFIMLTSTH